MKQRFLLIMVMVLAGLVTLLAPKQAIQAQEDDAEWEMVFFSQSYNFQGLLSVNEDMEYQTVSSDNLFIDSDEYYNQFAASPDKRYVAYVQGGNLAFMDLAQDLFYFATNPQVPVSPTAIHFKSVAFSPDSKLFATSFRYDVYEEHTVVDAFGGILIAEIVPGGTIVETYLADEDDRWYADELSWEEEGIYFQWSNYRYEPPLSWYDKLWVPGTTEFQTTNRFHNYYSARLPLTNELLVIDHDLDYPASELGYADYSGNLIGYYADSDAFKNEENPEPQYVYWDSIDYVAGQPVWGMDGAGFVVTGSDIQILVLRDGTQIPINRPIHSYRGDVSVWGTPTGWLMHHSDNDMLTHYIYSTETGIVASNIVKISGNIFLLEAPILGYASTGEFVAIPLADEITVDTNFLEPITCDGTNPSRLTIGLTASVTPGGANNVRSEASANADVVGQIPGGASFTVLAGPICADSLAWWQVEYEGITGWTAEGQGDTYWLEP